MLTTGNKLQLIVVRANIVIMIDLASIRAEAGVTQAEMARRLRMTQSAVSQAERRGDLLLSTLGGYLSALGADAQMTITVGGRRYVHDLTEGSR